MNTINVELLDSEGQAVGPPRYILDVAAPFLDRYLGPLWRQAEPPVLILMPIPGENNTIPGDRPLAYHTEAIGYILVEVVRSGRYFYHHPHEVAEVLGPGLERWMAESENPGKAAGYRIVGAGIERLVQRSTPIPKGVAEVAPYAPGEGPAFRIRPIPPEPPGPNSLEAFGADPPAPDWQGPGRTDFVRVVIDKALHDDLLHRRPFSSRVEEGGFLAGNIYEDRDRPGAYIAHVSAAVPAEQVGASFLHFTFTGDSFTLIKQRLAIEHQGQKLLGWFHTHLFPATDTLGLSSIDLRLHFTTFRIPWQIAGLINLDGADRVLRFYVRQGDDMALCHHQPVEKGDRQ